MSEWQGIETAPEDGSRILGAGNDGYGGRKVAVTSWDRRGWTDESATTDDGHGWYGHDTWEPTHWMPLPQPPIASDSIIKQNQGPT